MENSVFSSRDFCDALEIAASLTVPPEEDSLLRQAFFLNQARSLIREREEKLGRKLRSCTVTFGCQMNERDSEKLRGILSLAGFQETDSEAADFVIYNTCTVRENANIRVFGRLGALSSLRKKNPSMLIALCGCMMQEKEVVEKIRSSFPFVNLVFGTHNLYRFPEYLNRVLMAQESEALEAAGKKQKKRPLQIIELQDREGGIIEELPAERSYSFKSGVNIMFGCDNFCSYCIVPYVRGRERSREPLDILREAEELAKDGVVELMLLGQNVNSYGKGLKDPVSFALLIQELEKVEGIERIRFMTSHPKDLSDDLISVMAESSKICHHLHLPLQSGSSRLLKRMNRHYSKESYLELVEKLREKIPDLSLTTDIIVGFPGETEEDFLETLEVVRAAGYDSAFTFLYSQRTGTPAASWEQVPEEIAHERFDRLLQVVQSIGRERSSRFEGQVLPVLVESENHQQKGLVTGRIPQNLVVHFPGGTDLIGQIVPVRLTTAQGFYYLGERAD